MYERIRDRMIFTKTHGERRSSNDLDCILYTWIKKTTSVDDESPGRRGITGRSVFHRQFLIEPVFNRGYCVHTYISVRTHAVMHRRSWKRIVWQDNTIFKNIYNNTSTMSRQCAGLILKDNLNCSNYPFSFRFLGTSRKWKILELLRLIDCQCLDIYYYSIYIFNQLHSFPFQLVISLRITTFWRIDNWPWVKKSLIRFAILKTTWNQFK